MNKILFYPILFFVLIVYIYSIVFNAFPISTKIILEFLGFLYCFRYIFSPDYRLKKEYKVIIEIIFVIVFWDILTSFFNGQTEYHLIKSLVPAIGGIFAAHMIFEYTKKHNVDADKIVLLIVITIFFESIFSIVMKFYPPLFDTVSSFLQFEFLKDDSIQFNLSRFIGIGNALFFGVLPSCLLGIMAAIYLLSQSKSITQSVLLILMWVVISIVSFFTARWAITLIGLSILFFLVNQRGKNLFKSLSLILGVIIIVGIALLFTMNNIDDELSSWAFGFLLDPSSSDDHTSDYMIYWWTNTSFDIKTLLIGDALYSLPNGKYYGGSDVGFFRQIYYGGIIGLVLNLWAHYKVLKMTYKYKRLRSFKYFLIFLMLGHLAILVKGDATMLTFYIFLLVYYSGGAFENLPRKIKKSIYNTAIL